MRRLIFDDRDGSACGLGVIAFDAAGARLVADVLIGALMTACADFKAR